MRAAEKPAFGSVDHCPLELRPHLRVRHVEVGLEVVEPVEETGEELIVTDNHRPVLKVIPIQQRRPAAEVFSDLRGKVVYRGDILEPTTDEWPER